MRPFRIAKATLTPDDRRDIARAMRRTGRQGEKNAALFCDRVAEILAEHARLAPPAGPAPTRPRKHREKTRAVIDRLYRALRAVTVGKRAEDRAARELLRREWEWRAQHTTHAAAVLREWSHPAKRRLRLTFDEVAGAAPRHVKSGKGERATALSLWMLTQREADAAVAVAFDKALADIEAALLYACKASYGAAGNPAATPTERMFWLSVANEWHVATGRPATASGEHNPFVAAVAAIAYGANLRPPSLHVLRSILPP